MARFRCPSSSPPGDNTSRTTHNYSQHTLASSLSSGSGTRTSSSGSSKSHKGKGKDHGRIRSQSGKEPTQRQRYKEALMKEKAKNRKHEREWSFVFVGNLNSTITEEVLRREFQRFGKILRICIRIGGGTFVPKSTGNIGHRVVPGERQYASIEFDRASSARKALSLNDKVVNGIRIKVCFSAIDLPESEDIIKQHLGNTLPRTNSFMDWKSRLAALKRLSAQRTERIILPSGNTETQASSAAGPSHPEPSRQPPAVPRNPELVPDVRAMKPPSRMSNFKKLAVGLLVLGAFVS